MTDIQVNLGRELLKSLVGLKEKKGNLSLADVGGMFMQMASNLNATTSAADQAMHEEIKRLAAYIHDAKHEIFAISTNDKSEAVIMDASQHLDEVIKATEEASNTIMDAADAIQAETGGIGGDKETKIMDATIRIYNACNFQDITGQRITKVIKLLANIEERLGKLNAIFGTTGGNVTAANGKANGEIVVPLDEKELLNGPQLKGQAASQAEIDALFASLGGKS